MKILKISNGLLLIAFFKAVQTGLNIYNDQIPLAIVNGPMIIIWVALASASRKKGY